MTNRANRSSSGSNTVRDYEGLNTTAINKDPPPVTHGRRAISTHYQRHLSGDRLVAGVPVVKLTENFPTTWLKTKTIG
ncbi:hypothetical protein EVAR_5173_1 [Eumeta japonica]|uniref:Uncharacterized protein n=1 Tax=Eumeta variegata TaxID=151549 RepID=A0A4C1V3V0_EUMVA|nr:hypothetical protein EVAR_5173_1 [Eumeta japonica]